MEALLEWLNPLRWLAWAQDHPWLTLAIVVPAAAFVVWRLVKGGLGIRRAVINVVGIALVVWGAQWFADWVKPSLTPQDLFTPPVVGPQAVKAVFVEQKTIERWATYTGAVHPYERVVLRARTDGFVENVLVYPGDRVEEGQIVVQQETSELEPKLEETLAELRYLRAEFNRDSRLVETGAIAASQFDLSRKQLQAMEAKVDLLKTEIGYATVRALSDGWVSKRAVDPGQYVRKGDHLLAYDRLAKVRVRFDVSVQDLVHIAPGTDVVLELSEIPTERLAGTELADKLAPGYRTAAVRAKVTSVFPSADERTRLGVVEVVMPNPDLVLKSNTYVIAHFVTGRAENAWVVPEAALTPILGGKTVVFLAPAFADEGAAEMREVKVGLRNRREVQILEGLSEPAFVVVAGNRSLTEGETVTVIAREGGLYTDSMNKPSPQYESGKRFSLPRLALRFPHLTIVLSLLMAGLGVYAYLAIPSRMAPRIPTPNIGVVTQFPGMSAEDMERYIQRPLEKRLQVAGGVQYTLGVSQEGYSKIVLYFRYDVDLDEKRQEVKNLLDVVANELPRAGANVTVPRVIHVDRQNVPPIQFAVRRAGYDRARLKEQLSNIILTQFQKIPGVLAAWTFGGLDRQIQIVVDRNKLAAFGLSILDTQRAIDAANFDRGGGPLLDGEREIQVRVPNEFREGEILARLPRLPVGNFEGKVVYLEEVASVKDTIATQYGDFFYNGESAVWLGVQGEAHRDVEEIVADAKELARLLENEYPGLTFDVVFDQTLYLGLNDANALKEFFLAVALASLVVLLFLGEASGTMIAAAILPSAVAFGFFMILALGFQRDFGIMMGMVFIVGKVLDDSIIVIEAIRRRIERGEHPREAAVRGAEELQNVVFAATFTFVVIAFPMTLMTGDMGSGFRSMTTPMITSVIGSYFLALTLTPLMAAYMFKPSPHLSPSANAGGGTGTTLESLMPADERPAGKVGWLIYHVFLKYFHRFEHIFARLVDLAVTYRWVVVALAAGAIYITVVLFEQLGQEQMPLTDTSVAFGYLRAEPGTSFERMAEIVTEVERIALKQKHIRDASALTGKSPVWGQYFTGYGVNRVNEAQLVINMTIADERDETLWDIIAEVEREAKAKIPELQALFFQPLAPTPVAAARAPVEVLVRGPDPDQVHAIGKQIREMADTQSRGLHSPYLDAVYGVPQIRVEVDQARAKALGLTVADVVGQVYYAINGGFTETFFNPEPMYYHSRLLIRYRDTQRATPADLADLKIRTPQGSQVPLKTVADLREDVGYDRIHTFDTLYAASVLGYYRELGLKETTMSLMMPAKMQLSLPKGYSVGPAGLMGTMLQAFNELQVGLKIALVAVYLLLVVQFRSFAIGLVLMLAIPLQGLGAIGALWLRDMAWSPPVLWGQVVLAGIVLSNSILMIDKVLQLRRQGVERHTAIVAASTLRMRPVLMVALAAGAAMFHVAIDPPPATEQFRNIATGISGGLITSTLMTLIVIPVAYSLMDDFMRLLKRLYFGAPRAAEAVPEAALAELAPAAADGVPTETELEPTEVGQPEDDRRRGRRRYGS